MYIDENWNIWWVVLFIIYLFFLVCFSVMSKTTCCDFVLVFRKCLTLPELTKDQISSVLSAIYKRSTCGEQSSMSEIPNFVSTLRVKKTRMIYLVYAVVTTVCFWIWKKLSLLL